MRIHVHPADISEQLVAQQPIVSAAWRLDDEQTPGVWRILQKPVNAQLTEADWTLDDKSEEMIRVPMNVYRLPSPELGILVRLGLQVSAVVMGTLLPDGKLEELLMIHSTVYHRDDGVPGYQVWLGVAAKISQE
jgi:hypothetical protein